ncbi:MAG: response regulator transcription factor [Bacteroidetes bacterium]|nr:response regulator transcription factor [Bacteroidota bacterium]MBL6962296.1 response regulator transcription factor [Bacteroidota bacterium]
MKVLIIEDEVLAASRLSKMLGEINSQIEITDVIDSIGSALKWFKKNKEPDLLFLDIQLSDGLSFKIYEQHKFECPVIFTTAFDEYAIKAFEMNSIDYLLKPIHKNKLQSALNKFFNLQDRYGKDELNLKLEELIKKYKPEQSSYKSRFLVNKGNTLVPVGLGEIAYFFTNEGFVSIKTKEDKNFLVNHSMDELEHLLDPQKFFRVNRQFLISTDCISKIHPYFNYKLKLELFPANEKELIIPKQKVSDFKSWLNS